MLFPQSFNHCCSEIYVHLELLSHTPIKLVIYKFGVVRVVRFSVEFLKPV